VFGLFHRTPGYPLGGTPISGRNRLLGDGSEPCAPPRFGARGVKEC
jgi:hypothetical protein